MTDSLMDNYNPLYDVHLRQYFALPHMQKHLLKMGLLEKTIPGSGDEVLARHHAMMDLMLKNRETQLQRMSEIKQKLDAAEKVETCRRIRSGQSPESFRRAKPSRSLSRGRPAASGRQRRFSNSFEDKEMVTKLEKDHAEPNEFDPRDTYKRLSAKSKKYNYLHKMDDGTLTSYKDNLKSQLERLERFRELSFGVHSMARQPAPAQTSWFFRRRSLPSIHATSTGNALNESLRSNQKIRGRRMSPGIKLDASNDSRVSCPPTMRKRRDSNSRLPPIQPNKRSQTAQVVKSAPTKLPSTNGHPPRGRSVVKKSTIMSSVPKLPPVAGVIAGGAAVVGITAAAAVAAAQSPEFEPVPKDPSPAREEPQPETDIEPAPEHYEVETVHTEPEHMEEEEMFSKHEDPEEQHQERPVEYEEIQHEETYHEERAASPKDASSDESEPEYAESDHEKPIAVQHVVQQETEPESEHPDEESVHEEEIVDSPVHEISIVKHEATPRQLSEDEDYVPQEAPHHEIAHEENVAEEPETTQIENEAEHHRDEEPIHNVHVASYEEEANQGFYEKENEDPEYHHHSDVNEDVQAVEEHEPIAHSTPLGEPENEPIRNFHAEAEEDQHEVHKRSVANSISSEDMVENQVSEGAVENRGLVELPSEHERTSQDQEESYGFAEHRPSFTEEEESEPVEEQFHQQTHVEQYSQPEDAAPTQHLEHEYHVQAPTPRIEDEPEIEPDLLQEGEEHIEQETEQETEQDEPMKQEGEPEYHQQVPEEHDLMKEEDEDDQKIPEQFVQHLESKPTEELVEPEEPEDNIVDDIEEPFVKQEAVLQYEEVGSPVRQSESPEFELQHHDSGVTEQHNFTSEAHEEHIERHESPVYSHHEAPIDVDREHEHFDDEPQHLDNESYRSDVHDTLVQQFEEEAKADSPIEHIYQEEEHHYEPQEDLMSERSHHTHASEHFEQASHPEEHDSQMMDSYHQDLHQPTEIHHHEDHHQDIQEYSAHPEPPVHQEELHHSHPEQADTQMIESFHQDSRHSPEVHHDEEQVDDFQDHPKSPVNADHQEEYHEHHHHVPSHPESPAHSERSHILESHHYEAPHGGLQNEEHMEISSNHSREELIEPVQHFNSEPARKTPEDDNMSTDSMIIHDEEESKSEQENHYTIDPMTHSVYDRSSPSAYEPAYGSEEHNVHHIAESPAHPTESHDHHHEITHSPLGSLPDHPESRHSNTSTEGTRLPDTVGDMNQSFYQQSENMTSSIHHGEEEDDEENNNEDGRSTKSMESNELTRSVYNGNVDDEEVHHQNVSSL